MLHTINLVTTAAYPWKTGTAILPLLRAYYLAQRGYDTALYIPWVAPAEQPLIFGADRCFDTFRDQEACIRDYLPKPDCASLQINFYPAVYKAHIGSILPTCSLAGRVRACDWLILEEPEHLNWKHPWNRYDRKAARVTGIVLTDYLYYLRHNMPRYPMIAALLNGYNRWLIRHHCDDTLLLGRSIASWPGARYLFTSGIHPSFFRTVPIEYNSNKMYFMGKLIWEKGFRELIDLLSMAGVRQLDVFGMGKDRLEITSYAESKGVSFHFRGNSDHPAVDLEPYKIFINVSRSEVSCTTSAEALGQGKFVILPDIPSNRDYKKFKNCLMYSAPEKFVRQLHFSCAHQPVQDPKIRELSWEAAIDRLLEYYNDTQAKEPRNRPAHAE